MVIRCVSVRVCVCMPAEQDLFCYKAAGKLHLRVSQAVYDNDRVQNKFTGGYIARGAAIIRQMLNDVLRPTKGCELDKACRLVFQATGPTLVSKPALSTMAVRRVGDSYYTQDFAAHLFRDTILNKGVFDRVKVAAVRRAAESGSQLASLLPKENTVWQDLVSDVFTSPAVKRLVSALVTECEANGELTSISIDGTYKPAFTLLGQTSYRAPRSARASQSTPLQDQRFTLLTGLGLSGAIVMLHMAPSEASSHVVSAMVSDLSTSQLLQVRHVAVDDPSPKLQADVQEVCPNLRCLSLCIPHLAFVYESASWEHKTPGSRFLRRILLKVACVRGPQPNVSTQPLYVGGGTLTRAEQIKVDHIRKGDLGERKATRLLRDINTTNALRDRGEYIDLLGALATLYPQEMAKRTTSGRNLRSILVTSCSPDRLEFMFNEGRFKRTMTAHEQALFQTGVCGNEAFHREVKDTLSHVSMHPSVLDMKLSYLKIRKLLAHNSALYHQTIRRMEEPEVLARRVAMIDLWPGKAWIKWCGPSDTHGRGQFPATTAQRWAESKRLREWKASMKSTKKGINQQGRGVRRTIYRQPKNLKLLHKPRCQQ